MKNWRLILACLLIFQLGCGSPTLNVGGEDEDKDNVTGAGPVSIPAPTSGNIRSSSPSEDGLVTIVGGAGSVTPLSTVRVTNLGSNQASLINHLTDLVVRTAWAQEIVETTADVDGAFVIQIAAETGDTLQIVAVDPDTETESDPTEVVVPGNTPPLSFVPRALTVDGNGTAYVVGVTGDQAQISVINLNTGFETSTFDISISDPRQIDFDTTNNQLFITDPTDDVVLIVDTTDNSETTVSVTGALSITIDTFNNLAFVGTTDIVNSVVTINSNTNAVADSLSITNVDDPTATYQESPAIDIDAGGQIGVVSTFDDGSTQFNQLFFNGINANVTDQERFTSRNFQGVASISTIQAFAADRDNDEVVMIDPADSNNNVTLTVGDQPNLMAVDEAGSRTFVSNFGDHTITVINYVNNTVTNTLGVGLNPTSLAYDASAAILAVVNSGSQSVTLIGNADL